MKSQNWFTLIVILTSCLFFSCEKKPQASFRTDKAVYSAGDTVRLTNTIDFAKGNSWRMNIHS